MNFIEPTGSTYNSQKSRFRVVMLWIKSIHGFTADSFTIWADG